MKVIIIILFITLSYFIFFKSKKYNDNLNKFYNDTTLTSYQAYNKNFNMHCGYFDIYQNKLSDLLNLTKLTDNLNDFLIKNLQLNKSKNYKILDIGCGIGTTCNQIYNNYPNCDINGVTISDIQVNLSKNYPKIKVINCNYNNLIYQDNYFDRVYAIESLCHSDNFKCLSEIYRVLKNNKFVIILDTYLIDKIPKNVKNMLNKGWLSKFKRLDKFIKNLKKSGFKDIRYKCINKFIFPFCITFLLYLPIITIKSMFYKIGYNIEQKSNQKISMIIGMLLALFNKFGYYIIIAKKIKN